MSEQRPRTATVQRRTRETDVQVDVDLDGSGEYEISTGISFFDHMLESFAKHGLFDLRITAKGDLAVDAHHTVEDVGITLGQALREALGPAEGIRRYGAQLLPMAEAKVEVSVDVSNRPYLVYRVDLANDRIGSFDAALTEDFLYAFAQSAGLDSLRQGPAPRGGSRLQGHGPGAPDRAGARLPRPWHSHREGRALAGPKAAPFPFA
jgi:imidazoleglycerol-phosphate dehydratase